MCLFAIHICALVKYLLRFVAYLQIELFVFLLDYF